MLLLASILLVLGVVWLILAPLVTGASAPLSDGPDLESQIRELEALRDVAYESIRDLEYDFHAGKIGEADFQELSLRSKREALEIVGRLDALQARPDGSPRPGGQAS